MRVKNFAKVFKSLVDPHVSLKLWIVMTATLTDSLLLPQILATLPEGIMVCAPVDNGYRIIHANQAASSLLSCAPGELEGQMFEACLADHVEDTQLRQSILRAVRTRKNQTIQLENHDDGIVSWLSLSLIPLENFFLCRIDNICNQKINEMRMAEAHKLEALGQLAGGVAHDFNNILSIIDGYARIAAKETGMPPPVTDYLDKIRQSVRRGASLTKQLLAFGRKNTAPESNVDLGALVSDHEGLLGPLLDASIRLHINADEGVNIGAAPDLIGQILMNLILNSRDAMPGGGDIYVDVVALRQIQPKNAQTKGDYACLRVRDTGTGMDKVTQRRIFDPFFTTKEQGKGTGLGLSMVYGLVQQMKGVIDIESAPGKGTTMSLFFPLDIANTSAPPPEIDFPDEDEEPLRLDGYTALVAEDEPDLLRLVASMLSDMGMTVLTAANGNEALARQEGYEGHIDFLVTDVVMPEMSGVRLSELFTSLRPDSKTVYISGYPAAGNMARIELPQGALLLPKPVAYERLAQILGRMTQGSMQTGLSRMAGEWHPGETAKGE